MPKLGDIPGWRDEWELVLSASNLAAETVKKYVKHLDYFLTWLADHHATIADVEQIATTHAAAWMASMRERGLSDSSIRGRGFAVAKWFGYLVKRPECEVAVSPMDPIVLPVPTKPRIEIVDDDSVRALLATCEKGTFIGQRDEAILRLMIECGFRRFEVAGILLENLDMKRKTVAVLGKRRRWRTVPFGNKTALAIQRYLRLRARRADAETEPHLFLSQHRNPGGGSRAITGKGVYMMLESRCAKAGFGRIRPHRFRHAWAHDSKAAGASDEDVEVLGGWSPGSSEVRRYGAILAEERAHNRARSLGRGERF